MSDVSTLRLSDLARRAAAARNQGLWDETNALAMRGLWEVRHEGLDPLESTPFLNEMGNVAFQQGQLDLAEQRYSQALQLALEAGHASKEGGARVNLGAVANVQGRHRAAARSYLAGYRAYRRDGNEQGAGRALHNLGMLLADRGQFRRAAVCYAHAARRTAGDPVVQGMVLLNEAEVLTEIGRLEEAESACHQARERFRRMGMQPGLAGAHLREGEIRRRRGELEPALRAFECALQMGRELNIPLTRAEAWRGMARIHQTRGQHDRALVGYSAALRTFRGLDAGHELADRAVIEAAECLGEMIDARDPHLAGHCSAVARLSVSIAREMGVPLEQLKGILVGGYLHDVGKLDIDDRVLGKDGPLSPEERRIVELHAIFGAERVEALGLSWDVASGVRAHHENFDGSGYPDALRGEEIPLLARILRVADVFDSLTRAQVYRGAWSAAEAFDHIEERAGVLFDPLVVRAFRRLAGVRCAGAAESTPIAAEFREMKRRATRAA